MAPSERVSLEWEDEATRPARAAAQGPIPIVVGVTGHIDLREQDIEPLKRAVRQVLREIQDHAPDSPIVLLSPLAEGADRLVAKVALDEFDARLVAPLPLPQDVYEKDFPASVNEFRELLGRGRSLTLPLAEGNSDKGIRKKGSQRDLQYAQAGAFVVWHCQMLLALWNGIGGGGGGTGQIVGYALNGVERLFHDVWGTPEFPDVPVVYRIVTPRRKTDEIVGKPFARELLPADVAEGRARLDRFRRVIAQVNGFNRDCINASPRIVSTVLDSMRDLTPSKTAARLSPAANRVRRLYGIADALAGRFQAWSKFSLVALFSLALLAILCFEVYDDLWHSPLLFLVYPASLAAAWILYRAAQKYRVQNKHLDYRALAEGLRVQFFWRLAGLEEEVADHYLLNHRSELDWIRNAIRAWNVPSIRYSPEADEDPDRLRLVLEQWVYDQQQFFKNRKERDHRGRDRHHKWVAGLFFTGIAVAILFFVVAVVLGENRVVEAAHPWVIVLLALLPAVAAALGGYAEKMAFSAQAQRYAWMSDLFDRAARRITAHLDAGRFEEARALIFDLGKEALEENGNWVMLHRERPLEIHF